MRQFLLILIIGTLVATPAQIFAAVMSSTNFQIYADVVSVGGLRSTSTNFGLFDNLGDVGGSPTSSTSTSFRVDSGFIAMSPDASLTATVSVGSLSLGLLNEQSVASTAHTITVTTNSPTGYTVTAHADGNLRTFGGDSFPPVNDGTVSAGTTEYGLRTSGSEGQQNSADVGIGAADLTIASAASPITASVTTITFKAGYRGGTIAAGQYNQSITYTTVANF